MKYHRTFHIQATHFNDFQDYATIWPIFAPNQTFVDDFKTKNCELFIQQWGNEMVTEIPLNQLARLLTSCHGHNFRIDVVFELDDIDISSWLVSDNDLTALVMEWDNCNLSMLPEFLCRRIRATTENMVTTLMAKIIGAMWHGDLEVEEAGDDQLLKLTVTIWETDSIHASDTVSFDPIDACCEISERFKL